MLDAHAAEADRIRGVFTSRVDGIRGRKGLPEPVRLQMLAKAHQDATSLMSDLQSRVGSETDNAATQLRRKAFGAPDDADTMAMRDAHQRAAQLKSPSEAAAALRAAEMQEDEGLARAIAATAFDHAAGLGILGRPWAEVVDTYTAQRPKAGEAVESLAQMSKGPRVVDFTFVVPKPNGLSRLAPWQLNALASPDDAA
jgi:hypothetical protein